jgi:outer membrane protein insertion porin family
MYLIRALDRAIVLTFYCCLLLGGFSSCNATKFLAEDEQLLRKNEVRIESDRRISGKRKLAYELSTLAKQKPNTRFFFIPREYIYQRAAQAEKPSAFTRWVRRAIGEPPTIFSEEVTQASIEAMERHLTYRGFFNGKVYDNPKQSKSGKRVFMTYYVVPKEVKTIDSAFFLSEDENIQALLEKNREQTFLKPGAVLEGRLFERERERLTRLLRNSGYADFTANYVLPLVADTSVSAAKPNVYLEVLPPFNDSSHQVFYVGAITVYLDFAPERAEEALRDTLIGAVHFKYPENAYDIKPQTIVNALALRPGELYRQEAFDRTNRSLSALGVFRFVRLRQEVDSLRPDHLNFRVELTPNPKVEVGVDFEVNYTNRNTLAGAGNLIGISVSPSIRNRNIFRGAELLSSNLSAGVEVNPSALNNTRFWNTVDLRLQNELFIPRFIDHLGLWRAIGGIRLGRSEERAGAGRRDFYSLLQENAATRISLNYNYLLLLDYYRYNLFNGAFGLDVQRASNHRYLINLIAIDYLQPFFEPAFDTIRASNPFLARSFGRQLFVSLLFRDFNMQRTSRPNRYGASHYIGTQFEIAGTEVWAVNKLYNALAAQPDTFRLGAAEFAHYMKGEIDLRHYRQRTSSSSYAMRLAMGLALPLGFSTDVPYVKQFYVGGPSSIRAWPARSLGPGGHEDTTFNITSINNRLLFYQTGDIKLEFNLEYRFDILWRFKGAVFLDGGNVWTLREDPTRCGSQFLLGPSRRFCQDDARSYSGAFYRQIGLGSGFGLRLDLTYFIFRLDMGQRLRSPFPLRQRNGQFREADFWTNFNGWKLADINFNIGLGYPF